MRHTIYANLTNEELVIEALSTRVDDELIFELTRRLRLGEQGISKTYAPINFVDGDEKV